MNILYAKRFSKDLDAISHESKIKKRLLDLIEQIKRRDIRVIFGLGLAIIDLE
jgi:Txe/YoeB family toxin of Txe-Axe toxin-antitoxin module